MNERIEWHRRQETGLSSDTVQTWMSGSGIATERVERGLLPRERYSTVPGLRLYFH